MWCKNTGCAVHYACKMRGHVVGHCQPPSCTLLGTTHHHSKHESQSPLPSCVNAWRRTGSTLPPSVWELPPALWELPPALWELPPALWELLSGSYHQLSGSYHQVSGSYHQLSGSYHQLSG